MSVWQAARTADAALTRTVTDAILTPHETQRRLVRGSLRTDDTEALLEAAVAGIGIGIVTSPAGW